VSCVPAYRNAEPGSPDIVTRLPSDGPPAAVVLLQTAASGSLAKHDSPCVAEGLSSQNSVILFTSVH